MKEIDKTLTKILITLFLFILYIYYSSIILVLLNKIINVNLLSTNWQTAFDVIIEFSLMLIFYLIYHKKINSNIIDYKNNFKEYFKLGLKYWIIGITLMIIFNLIISLFYTSNSANEEIIQSALTEYPVIYMIFTTCLFAPFVEELIFRKSIRDIFNNKYNLIYIIISGLAFGFVHTLASNNIMELLYILPYGIVGSMFAYVYTKTDNILVPITFHLIHNSIIVFFSLIL